jgi:hypothetical protein
MGRGRISICALAGALALLAALPAAGRAQTASFTNETDIVIPGTYIGPANPYPSSVSVSGLSGPVAKASVLLSDVNPGGVIDALDLALVGPTGVKVMLWSDACGNNPFDDQAFVFDDSAAVFLSNLGPCAAGTYLPSNYEDPALDNLSAGGAGPSPPYTNSLSAFNGTSPNGSWGLFAYSDSDNDFIRIGGWTLTLQIQPPAATGQRAAALKKCKKKRTKKARKRCRKKARRLPV